MRKRFLGIFVVLFALCIALVGCGGGGGGETAAPKDESPEVSVDTKQDGKLGGGTETEAAPEADPAPEPEKDTTDYSSVFAGSWKLVKMEGEGNDTTEEDLVFMEEQGLITELVFADDGTATLIIFGEEFGTGTWKAISATECDVTMDGEKIDTVLDTSTGRLRFSQGSSAMYFVRNEGAAAAPSGGESSEKPADTPAVSYDTLDSVGNPTLYSIVELKGSDLVKAIEDGGFTWNTEKKWWVSATDRALFYVSSNDDYEYLAEEIAQFGEGGKGDSCVFVVVLDDRDYDSAGDAFKSLCNIEVLEEKWFDEEAGIAIVEGPSGRKDFVIITYNTDSGLYVIDVFNKAAVSSGLVDEYLGDNYGSTIDELAENLF